MQVWSENWTPTGALTLELTAQPAGITPAFTSQDSTICTPVATARNQCTMPTAPGGQHRVIQVQVPVASTATTVRQVTLNALAIPATAKLAGPLTATETAQVTAAPTKQPTKQPKQSKTPSKSATATSPGQVGNSLLGPIGQIGQIGIGALPTLNGAASSLISPGDASGIFPKISPGDASGIFPKISPSASPSPAPGSTAGQAKADPPQKMSLLPLGMPVVTAQIIGLIALALAFMLTLTRLSLHRRR